MIIHQIVTESHPELWSVANLLSVGAEILGLILGGFSAAILVMLTFCAHRPSRKISSKTEIP